MMEVYFALNCQTAIIKSLPLLIKLVHKKEKGLNSRLLFDLILNFGGTCATKRIYRFQIEKN